MATNQHWPAPVSPRCFKTKWMCASHFCVFAVCLPNEASHFQCLFLKWFSQKRLVRACGWCATRGSLYSPAQQKDTNIPLRRLVSNEDEAVHCMCQLSSPRASTWASPCTAPHGAWDPLREPRPQSSRSSHRGYFLCQSCLGSTHLPTLLSFPAAWKPVPPSAHLQ